MHTLRRWTRAAATAGGLVLGAGLLAGCASSVDAPTGFVSVGGAYAAMLAPDWTEITYEVPTSDAGVRVFSLDGPRLNQLYLAGDLPAGRPLLNVSTRPRPPEYERSVSPRRQAVFVTGTLASMGYQDIALRPPQNAELAGYNASRFEFAASTPDGLAVRGLMVMADGAQGLNAVLFVAAQEHYAARLGPEVTRLLTTARRTF